MLAGLSGGMNLRIRNFWFFVVLCRYPHKNQRGLELKITLSIENDEEPNFFSVL